MHTAHEDNYSAPKKLGMYKVPSKCYDYFVF